MKKVNYFSDAIELTKFAAFCIYISLVVIAVLFIFVYAIHLTMNFAFGDQITEGTVSHIAENNGGRSFTFYQRENGEMKVSHYFTRDEKLMETIGIGDYFNIECMCVLSESEIENGKDER